MPGTSDWLASGMAGSLVSASFSPAAMTAPRGASRTRMHPSSTVTAMFGSTSGRATRWSLIRRTADGDLADQAQNNTMANFKLVFDKKFLNTIVGRMDTDNAIFKQVIDDADFQAVLADFYLRKVYRRLRT